MINQPRPFANLKNTFIGDRVRTRSSSGKTESTETAKGGKQVDLTRVLLIAAIAVLGAIVLFELVMTFVVNPNLKLTSIEVQSELGYDQNYIFDRTGLSLESNYLAIDLEEVKEKLLAQAEIKSVEISQVFPSGLTVTLQGRKPLVQHVLPDNSVVLIDEDGVAFDYVKDRVAYDIPILSGVEFKDFRLGAKLPLYIVGFLKDLSDISIHSPNLLQAFSEFELISIGGVDAEVLCYTNESSVPVRIGSKITEEMCTSMLRVLSMMKRNTGFTHVKEVDLRSREVLIKKGDSD